MQPISYARHQFPPDIIRHAIWLCLRFTLSYRDVEELLAELSYETVRRWVLNFGPVFSRNLRRLRPRPSAQWHLDETAVVIGGQTPLALASGERETDGALVGVGVERHGRDQADIHSFERHAEPSAQLGRIARNPDPDPIASRAAERLAPRLSDCG